MMQRQGLRAAGTGAAVDAALAAALTFISAAPYLSALGFYSDDWALLAGFASGRSESLLTWDSVTFPGRPVQGFYLTLLFRAFGLDPFGYHLVNVAMLAISAALLCTLLVRLGVGRAQSFATTILFVLMPQLSTARVWYAAFQVALSMALMLASMHCMLSFFRSGKIGSAVGAIVAAGLSFAAYEIFAPLIAGFAIGAMLLRWRKSKGRDGRSLSAQAAGVTVLVLLAFVTKLVFSGGRAAQLPNVSEYVRGLHQLFRLDYDWRVDAGMNVFAAPQMYFGVPVQGWWAGARTLLSGNATFEVAVIAAVIAVVAAWRLARQEAISTETALRLLLLGIATLILGVAIFLVIPPIFTPTGIANRFHVAAALGAAMILVALISLSCSALPPRGRGIAFCAVIAFLAASAFVRMWTIERYWAEAPAIQRTILKAARVDLQKLPSGSTVILDGVCPYHGPAVVFDTSWDVAGALTLALGRPISGDAVSPRMSVTAQGLRTSMYGDPSFYPYGGNLYIYDPRTHSVVPLSNRAAAVRYFASRQPIACTGSVDRGAEV